MSRPGSTIRRFNRRVYALVFAVVTLSITAGLIIVSLANAGKGVVGVFGSSGSGDGQFANAYGTAVNLATGDVYVVDQFDHRVERFDASGGFLGAFGWGVADGSSAAQTCASGCQPGLQGSGDGQFDTPQGIAIDQSTNAVYVVDGNNNRVEKFDATGTYVSQFGSAGNGDGQFSGPQGVAVASDGSVYVADTGDHRVEKFDNTGAFVSQFGSEGSGDGQFEGPTRVAVDSTDKTYVLDSGNSRVERFTSAGAFDQVFDPTDVSAPQEIAVGPGNDHLYVAQWAQDFSEHRVIEVDGATGTLVDTHGVGSGANNSSGLALNAASQKIYLADGFNARVFILDDVTAPDVTIDPPTGVTSTGASLSGTVNPNGNPDMGWRFEISTDDANWSPIAPNQDPDSGNSAVPVTQNLSGLVPNTTYFVRLAARRAFNALAISSEVQFATDAVTPDVVTEPPNDLAPTHATLQATVNPNHSDTTYFFEYGATTGYGQRIPATDLDAGAGTNVMAAIQRIDSLSPGATYHFRIVATNQAGTVHGQDQAVTTTTPPPASTSRHGIPGAGFLPDDRGWELVSPPDKGGNDVMADTARTRAAADGGAVSFVALGGFGDVQGSGVSVEYMGIRNGQSGTSGWSTHAITPHQGPLAFQWVLAGFDPYYEGEFSADLSRGVLRTSSPVTNEPNVAHVGNLYMRNDLRTPGPGSYELLTDCLVCGSTPLSSLLTGSVTDQLPRFAGASADFGHVIFESVHKLTPDATATGQPFSPENLYEWDHGTLRLAGILPDGSAAAESQAGPGAVNLFYMPRTISADGSRIFFTVNPNGVQFDGALYERIAHSTTVPLNVSERTDCADHDSCSGTPEPDPNGPQSTRFWGANAAGTRAFFTSSELLTDNAQSAVTNLYMYDEEQPAGHRLSSLMAGANGVRGVIGMSDDGHYVYVLADGQPVGGQPAIGTGIYLWHDGTISYVGEMRDPGKDSSLNLPTGWGYPSRFAGRVTPDGQHLLFTSDTSQGLTGDSQGVCQGGCEELYVYSAATHALRCVSCDPSGAPGTGDAVDNTRVRVSGSGTTWHLNRPISGDGRWVFFTTLDSLVSNDTNGKNDVYEYDVLSGTVHLISSGRDPSDSYFMDASASGNDVFFLTRQQLTGWDHDQNYDLYDARVGGGLPEPAKEAQPCTGDGCQGALNGPASFDAPSSIHLSGVGNVKPVLKKVTPKPLTKAQKLKRALKKCKSKHKRVQRKRCEASVHKSFGRTK